MPKIIDQLRKDMFTASKDGNVEVKDIAQMALSSIKNEQIESEETLTEEQVIAILRKEVKKLNDGKSQFEAAGRDDLAVINAKQIEYLEQFLPQMMERADVEKIVADKKVAVGAESMRDMGKLMGAVMGELQGKADGVMVKEVVMEALK